MFSSCRRTSHHLDVSVEQTALLYKEGLEPPCQPWHHEPVDHPELVQLELDGPTRNLPVGECGVSW
jgi:hypothetical protein